MISVIYLVNSKSMSPALFDKLYHLLPQNAQTQVNRMHIKQDMYNRLIGYFLSRFAIKKTFNININKQRFASTKSGKPYLLNYPDVHFNISHSGEYVACVVSDKSIGVDIQKIVTYNYDVAKRVCSEKELKQIESSSDSASEFTKLWTQKEAVLKMHGIGIASGDIKTCLDNHSVQSERIEDYWLSVSIYN